MNRDGYSDLIVGEPFYDNGQMEEGRARVYEGSSTGPSFTPSWTVESNFAAANLALAVGTAGDVNGDGYSDILVGSYNYSNGQDREGKVFLYAGSAAGVEDFASWTVESNADGFSMGYALDTAGDVNGDGFSDVLVSAPNLSWNARSHDPTVEDHATAREGRAYIYAGSQDGPMTVPLWEAGSLQDGSQFGVTVSTAGDVNGDGFSDVLAGSYLYDNGEENEGRAFLYYGNDGDGLHRIPRQARSDDAAPIDLLGRSNSISSFRVKALGRTPAGRGRVRLEVEVKPLAVPFDGLGLIAGPLTNTGAPTGGGSAVPLSISVGGLAHATPYHWRMRFRTDSPLFLRSPWFSMAGNARTETDLRTAFTVGIEESMSTPPAAQLLAPAAPNPFSVETELAYTLPDAGRIHAAVYDVTGRMVVELADEVRAAGRHTLRWDGRDDAGHRLPAGVYLVRLASRTAAQARKVVISPD